MKGFGPGHEGTREIFRGRGVKGWRRMDVRHFPWVEMMLMTGDFRVHTIPRGSTAAIIGVNWMKTILPDKTLTLRLAVILHAIGNAVKKHGKTSGTDHRPFALSAPWFSCKSRATQWSGICTTDQAS